MKIFVCPNLYTPEQREDTKETIRVLTEKGHSCALSPSDAETLYSDSSHASFEAKDADLIISIGGDGAVLRAAQKAIHAEVPLLGINSGRLGYLCAMTLDEIGRFDEIIETSLSTVRSLLEFTTKDTVHYALNDVVFAKKDFGTSVDLTVISDKDDVLQIRGDGLIIATPTGSTAYNLSSGGSILDTEAPVYTVTPISAHASLSHPVIFSDEKVIEVSERNKDAVIYADGILCGRPDVPVKVKISKKTMTLIVRKRPLNDIAKLH